MISHTNAELAWTPSSSGENLDNVQNNTQLHFLLLLYNSLSASTMILLYFYLC